MDNQTVRVRRSVAMVALSAALLIGGTLAWTFATGSHTVLGASPTVTLRMANPNSSPVGPVSLQDGFSSIVEPLLPAVVNISSSKMVKAEHSESPFQDDPFFRQFFGNPNDNGNGEGNGQAGPGQGNGGGGNGDQPREEREHSLGSGVIVSPDGYILTNNHVVDGATDIEVSLKDKRQLKAKVIGADPRTDIAVLKVDATGLATVTIGASAKSRIGDIVLAIGDPFGVGETVTMGIVSATGRRDLNIEGDGGYEDFIQTDASINPGNSGGALVNTRGELIGINTAIISNGGGGNQGIGFAVPIDMARKVMEQLISTGKVSRGYLGVMIQPLTPALAKAFNIPSAQGALVGDVTADSPGAKAGLQKGDVITAINGQDVADSYDLRLRISQSAPGESVKLGIIRNGKPMDVSTKLAEFPEKAAAAAEPPSSENSLEGVQVEELSSAIAQQLGLPSGTRGVVVGSVDPNSPAADGGLTRGDVIQEINHSPITNIEQFRTAVHAAGKQSLLLLVNHMGSTAYVVISPRE
jgi:serine protease Do